MSNSKTGIILAAMAFSAGARAQSVDSRAVLDAWIANTETHVVQAADALGEDKFNFAPAGAGFKGVRTFGDQVRHLAALNYMVAARILGEQPPQGEHDEEAPGSVRTKAQTLEYVQGSFAYLHRAVASLSGSALAQPIPGTKGTWQSSRLGLVVDAVAHSFDHYGQMVEYLRMNGVVPPDSR